MLDAFIIDKIRRERESREIERAPLHIDVPREGPYDHDPRRDDEDDRHERGVVIIDFTI